MEAGRNFMTISDRIKKDNYEKDDFNKLNEYHAEIGKLKNEMKEYFERINI